MAIKIDSIKDLKIHLDGVMRRADHHGQQVYKSVLPLVGLIAWKADTIDARTTNGVSANMIWFETSKKERYAVVFNHEKAKIDIRERTQQGKTLLEVDNSTPIDDLIDFFDSM